MKQNPCPVIGEVTKPTDIGLDELDGAVETFRAGIADFVLTEIEQPRLVTAQHLDHLFDRLQSTAHRVGGPGIKESLGRTLVAVAPELGEILLDGPRPAGLEVELVQGPKRHRLGAATIGVAFEPRPLTSSQRGASHLREATVLLFAYRIHRFPEVLGDVKLVMHDISLGHALLGRTHKGWPHIHGHRFDRGTLGRRKAE
jgi:hypothetical protein